MKRLVSAILLACAAQPAFAEEFSDNLLQGIEGVGVQVRTPHVRSNRFELDGPMLERHIKEQLGNLQVPVLSESALAEEPGQPYLEVGVNVAHAQGPSHLYTVTLKLREMAALERPKSASVSMALSTWERESMGIANRPEAVLQALDKMIRLFTQELHRTNNEEPS